MPSDVIPVWLVKEKQKFSLKISIEHSWSQHNTYTCVYQCVCYEINIFVCTYDITSQCFIVLPDPFLKLCLSVTSHEINSSTVVLTVKLIKCLLYHIVDEIVQSIVCIVCINRQYTSFLKVNLYHIPIHAFALVSEDQILSYRLCKHVHMLLVAKGTTLNINYCAHGMYCIKHMIMASPTQSTRIVPLPFLFNCYPPEYIISCIIL